MSSKNVNFEYPQQNHSTFLNSYISHTSFCHLFSGAVVHISSLLCFLQADGLPLVSVIIIIILLLLNELIIVALSPKTARTLNKEKNELCNAIGQN